MRLSLSASLGRCLALAASMVSRWLPVRDTLAWSSMEKRNVVASCAVHLCLPCSLKLFQGFCPSLCWTLGQCWLPSSIKYPSIFLSHMTSACLQPLPLPISLAQDTGLPSSTTCSRRSHSTTNRLAHPISTTCSLCPPCLSLSLDFSFPSSPPCSHLSFCHFLPPCIFLPSPPPHTPGETYQNSPLVK